MTEPKIKPRGLALKAVEVRDLVHDRVHAVLRPAMGVNDIHGGVAHHQWKHWHHPDDHGYIVDCPLATVGGMVFGQEQWQTQNDVVLYRADVPPTDRSERRWRSSASMPRWASRIHRRVKSIAIVDSKRLTEEQVALFGGMPIKDPVVSFNTIESPYCWLLALETIVAEASP